MTNEELIKLVQNEENYQENYNLLVSSSRNRGLNKSKLDYYTEKHHIILRCMGGKDEDDKERFPNKLKEYESRNQNSIETD